MTVTISSKDIVERDVFVVENIVGALFPTTHTDFPPDLRANRLLICTGTAVFDFSVDDGVRREPLQFFIPDENGDPLDLNLIYPDAFLFHEATVASLASITDGSGPWAVDDVEVIQVIDPEAPGKSFLQLSADLAVGKGSHLLRMAYQANILLFQG